MRFEESEIFTIKPGIKRRQIKCQEETGQDQEVRELEQVEAWVEAEVAWGVELVAVAREVDLRRAREVFAFAPTVEKEQPINWGLRVMSRNAQNAATP